MPNRFISQKDIDTFDKINKELVGNLLTAQDGYINQTVVVYKISVNETETNMYGEAGKGKIFNPGVQLACIVDAADMEYNTDEFGPDLRQTATFAFLRQSLVDVDYVVDIGDVIEWNESYWEIGSLNENQLVGGVVDNNHSIVATAHLTRLSTTNIEQHRGF